MPLTILSTRVLFSVTVYLALHIDHHSLSHWSLLLLTRARQIPRHFKMDENWEVVCTKYACVWFSNHGSHRLGCWREREVIIWNFTLHYTLSSQAGSNELSACPDITRHTGGCCFVIVVWWWLACVVHSCQVGYWQVGNCGYRLHAINCWVTTTYYCGVNLFLKEVKTPYCLRRWCETPSVIQQQQKKKWVFW